jgi:hypothetical protein
MGNKRSADVGQFSYVCALIDSMVLLALVDGFGNTLFIQA